MIRRSHILSTAAAVVLLTFIGAAQERDRAKIPDRYKWNLADIYPSDAAWRAAKEKLVGAVPKIREFQGTLGSSASRLADAMEFVTALNKDYARLAVYASMMADQDTR